MHCGQAHTHTHTHTHTPTRYRYGAWPTQLFLFQHGLLIHKATPEAAVFDVFDFWQVVMTAIDAESMQML
jgi:hypothetical protein